MYLDVAAGNSYGRYNIKFATIVGLNTAVYWSCMMNILERVSEKKTYDANGFFTLNRSYVESKTTLSKDTQLECDSVLVKLGLLDVSPDSSNKLRVDMKKFFALITEEDLHEIAEITKISKSATKASQSEGRKAGIILRLQNSLVETDADLLQAYKDWIEVCYNKGVCTVPQVKVFKEAVESYSSDKDVKLSVIKTATSLAYKEAAWAIQIYEKNNKTKKAFSTGKQKIGSSVKADVAF